jgi:hypothetical protein
VTNEDAAQGIARIRSRWSAKPLITRLHSRSKLPIATRIDNPDGHLRRIVSDPALSRMSRPLPCSVGDGGNRRHAQAPARVNPAIILGPRTKQTSRLGQEPRMSQFGLRDPGTGREVDQLR